MPEASFDGSAHRILIPVPFQFQVNNNINFNCPDSLSASAPGLKMSAGTLDDWLHFPPGVRCGTEAGMAEVTRKCRLTLPLQGPRQITPTSIRLEEEPGRTQNEKMDSTE